MHRLDSSHRSSGADNAIISSESWLPRPGAAYRRPDAEQCALSDGNAVAASIWASTKAFAMRGARVSCRH